VEDHAFDKRRPVPATRRAASENIRPNRAIPLRAESIKEVITDRATVLPLGS